MKKKIIGIAAAIMTLVAISASAQTSSTTSTCTNDKAKCQKAEKCCKEKGKCINPFEGLNLTDAQKQSLKDLKKSSCKKDSANCKAKKAECKAQGKDCKADRARRMKDARKEYLMQIKNILTPEQYQQFLENNFINNAPKHHKDGFKKDSAKKCMKKKECKRS